MRHDDGLFQLCLGSKRCESEPDFEAISAMHDAEEAFDLIMVQTARTKFDSDLHVRLALSALIGAWGCVCRSRAAAGY